MLLAIVGPVYFMVAVASRLLQTWLPPQCRAGDTSFKYGDQKAISKHKWILHGVLGFYIRVNKVRVIFKFLRFDQSQWHYWENQGRTPSVSTYRIIVDLNFEPSVPTITKGNKVNRKKTGALIQAFGFSDPEKHPRLRTNTHMRAICSESWDCCLSCHRKISSETLGSD